VKTPKPNVVMMFRFLSDTARPRERSVIERANLLAGRRSSHALIAAFVRRREGEVAAEAP
jgi:hypothetical protein